MATETTERTDPHNSTPEVVFPPHPRKGVGVKGKKVLGAGLGSVRSVVSVAHPGWGEGETLSKLTFPPHY